VRGDGSVPRSEDPGHAREPGGSVRVQEDVDLMGYDCIVLEGEQRNAFLRTAV